MKELFLTAIMQPPEVLLSTFVCLCVCFFFMFPCSNVHLVRAYLLTYYSNDLRYRLNQLNCMTKLNNGLKSIGKRYMVIKFIYFERVTKFCEISTNHLSYSCVHKSSDSFFPKILKKPSIVQK